MIGNIIDRRRRPYRSRAVNAVVEAIEHDNTVPDSDQAQEADVRTVVDFDLRLAISVQDAVQWASQQRCTVTLYLYDPGEGPEGSDGPGQTTHFHAVGNRFPDE